VSQDQYIIWTKYGGFIKNCLSNRWQFHNFSGTHWCAVHLQMHFTKLAW